MQLAFESTLTCPECSYAEKLDLPDDYCQIVHVCTRCGTKLRPKTGDCCIFCSYGDVQCPSKQQEALENNNEVIVCK
jgi:hypothetical protein